MNDNQEIPTSWTSIQLKQIIVKGAGSVNPALFPEELFELYSIPAYDEGKPEYVKGNNIGSTKKVLREGDVLISRIVPHIQRSWVVPKSKGRRQIGSNEWIVFHGEFFITTYLRYFLLSPGFHQEFMKTISGVGGSLTRANPDQVAELQFPIPPLAEQERIVAKIEELFSSLDKGIESLKTAQEQLKVYRQAVLKQAFEGKLTNENVKDGELPEGWGIINVGSLFVSIHGGSTVVPHDIRTEYPILRSSSVRSGRIDYSDVKYVSKEDFNNNNSLVAEGDLLFTRLNGTVEYVGNCALVSQYYPKNLLYPDRLYCGKIKDKSYSRYLEYIFQAQYIRKAIEKKAKSTAGHKRIAIPDIQEIKIPVPTKEEAQNIVLAIESRLPLCDKLEESIARGLEEAEALRQSILKKAFEGRLVPQDPKDEPASALLERIRAEREASGLVAPRGKKKAATSDRKSSPATAPVAREPRKRGRPRKAPKD